MVNLTYKLLIGSAVVNTVVTAGAFFFFVVKEMMQ